MPGTANFDTREHRFANVAALTEALALEITGTLQDGLAAGRGASLAVRAERDGDDVWVTLTDERWVDATSPSSNEKLVRDHLLREAAAEAHFVGLKNAAAEAHSGAHLSWSTIAELPRPFDFMLLGMGEDGHVASLFPDSPGLAVALDLSQPPGCVAMTAPEPPRARMSLNMRALLDSRRIAVLIVGNAKWATYDRG